MLLLIIHLICPFFFLAKQIFCFLASVRARVFKFCVYIESCQVYCETENKTAEMFFAFFFPLSHSNVIHREICDKYFSGTIVHRIL